MRLEGPLGFATVGRWLAQPPSTDTLDLGAVTQVDSAGLSLLLELKRRAQARGLVLGFTNIPGTVRRLAGHFGISGILGIDQ